MIVMNDDVISHIGEFLSHKDLFLSVEKKIKNFNSNSLKKYEMLIKLFDRADIINEIK